MGKQQDKNFTIRKRGGRGRGGGGMIEVANNDADHDSFLNQVRITDTGTQCSPKNNKKNNKER